MSDRGAFRGGGGGGRGRGGDRGDRGDRGGRGGGRGGAQGAQQQERPKKENILDLAKYMDKEVKVKFNGGREVQGTLKGFDQLMNLVLDNVKEHMRDEEGETTTRDLGLLVARGTLLVLISPMDGSEEIANPFNAEDDDVMFGGFEEPAERRAREQRLAEEEAANLPTAASPETQERVVVWREAIDDDLYETFIDRQYPAGASLNNHMHGVVGGVMMKQDGKDVRIITREFDSGGDSGPG